jgi:hypothetical protein
LLNKSSVTEASNQSKHEMFAYQGSKEIENEKNENHETISMQNIGK